MGDYSDKHKTAEFFMYRELKQFAKENRQNMTDAEYVIWQNLRRNNLGVKFRRQHVIDSFIADFACLDEMLIVEIDGEYHNTPEQQQEDELRSKVLSSLGYRILRFTNDQVLYDTESVISSIKNEIKFTKPN